LLCTLPRTVLPRLYEIELDASPRKKTFRCQVAITVQVAARTASVELPDRVPGFATGAYRIAAQETALGAENTAPVAVP
jgi:hypothetical protein